MGRLVGSILFLGIVIITQNTIGYWFDEKIFHRYTEIVYIISITWLLIEIIRFIKGYLLKRFSLDNENVEISQKVHTQVNIFQNIVISLLIIVAIGYILFSFESIRKIGIGLFASAGVAGIILGLSAQKLMANLLAGIQIAITQPFRIDDSVIVEGEWGWIEEINITYVVVKTWYKKRLIVPSQYFLEKPFQNWTRNGADIKGAVYLYTDYSISFDALREELTRILQSTDLWDGQTNDLHVTNANEKSVEIRILVSAKNSLNAWDLRALIREKMIEFIQENFPTAFSRTRVEVKP